MVHGVVFQASMNFRALFVVPFPIIEALDQSNALQVVRQCRARREFSSCRLTALWISFIRVANWRPVWPTWAQGHSKQGMLYTTFCRLCVGRRAFTCTSVFRNLFLIAIILWCVVETKLMKCGVCARQRYVHIRLAHMMTPLRARDIGNNANNGGVGWYMSVSSKHINLIKSFFKPTPNLACCISAAL